MVLQSWEVSYRIIATSMKLLAWLLELQKQFEQESELQGTYYEIDNEYSILQIMLGPSLELFAFLFSLKMSNTL